MGLAKLSDSLASKLVPIAGDAEDVCPLCRTGKKPEYLLCWSCNETSSQVSCPETRVIPISYYKKGSPLGELMHNYKEPGDAKVRRKEKRAVAAIFARYLREHAAALANSFGEWEAVVAVPSTRRPRRRSSPPALQAAIEDHFGHIVGTFETCLKLGSESMGRNAASESGFKVIGDIEGRSFLLIDDTFTTGARLQSAHHALVSAGATVPVSMVVTRKINPSEEWGTAALWERQSNVRFCFDDPPWWKA